MKEEAKFLGHIISSEGYTADAKKTKVIKNYRQSQNIRQIRAFLGLSGFYCKFVKNFSELSAPLSNLTKKSNHFNWSTDQKNALKKLKTALSTPILKYPVFSKTIYSSH